VRYKGTVQDVSKQKSPVRFEIRNILYLIVLLFVPSLLLARRLGLVTFTFDGTSFWVLWLGFVVGWIIIMLVSLGVAMRTFVRSLELSEWDTLLFDRFYGYDIEAWSSFLCYFGLLLFFSIQYGMAVVFSELKIFGLMIFVAALISSIFTLILSKIIFKSVLYAA
jgi:hypothetical protein